jgi:drug/metabolite transporter (DMT)-like permease
MERATLIGIRYVLPVALIVAGVVLLFAGTDSNRWDGFAMCVGAGLAVALMNALFRFGASGDRERTAEEEARRFFAEHGHWPDEEPPPTAR